MHWKCKYCLFSSEKRAQLFKHYRLKHGSYARTTPIPCLHTDCLCSFKSFNALKVHLTRNHSHEVHDGQTSGADEIPVIFNRPLCNFEEPCTDLFFSHLRQHLKSKETVKCPYENCIFESNLYSTFNAHKCKDHRLPSQKRLKPDFAMRSTPQIQIQVCHKMCKKLRIFLVILQTKTTLRQKLKSKIWIIYSINLSIV